MTGPGEDRPPRSGGTISNTVASCSGTTVQAGHINAVHVHTTTVRSRPLLPIAGVLAIAVGLMAWAMTARAEREIPDRGGSG
ncbi:hypothetical protein [Goodfellowiella coeruleoviolacea]|uniref:Uncharacterized protein n=1 Tax=Goodfellowiella coeruleoviolacea TaxID=334858 RepID=A0AAE3KIV1_9PSEU|nr:hypothetical protein [Goodfellowiella coeruleoviolacea]MCP2168382.1 hypothetical protein [Goodfellowiella coeruleoviolacea]